MGDIRNYVCSCGYEQRIFYGAGMAARNMQTIERFFPEEAKMLAEEKENFEKYLLQHMFAKCESCKKLLTVPQLMYQKKGESPQYVQLACPECGKEPVSCETEEQVACPVCGEPMRYDVIGAWD